MKATTGNPNTRKSAAKVRPGTLSESTGRRFRQNRMKVRFTRQRSGSG